MIDRVIFGSEFLLAVSLTVGFILLRSLVKRAAGYWLKKRK